VALAACRSQISPNTWSSINRASVRFSFCVDFTGLVISKACFLNDCLLGKQYAECAKRVADHNSCVPQPGEIKQIKQYSPLTETLLHVRVDYFRVHLDTRKITRGEVSRRRRRSLLRVPDYVTSGPRSTNP